MSEIAILILLITLTILFIEALIHFNVGKNIKIKELESLMQKCQCKTEINVKKILENQANIKITKDMGIYLPNLSEIGSIIITIILSYLIIYYIDKFIENNF